VYQHNKTKKSIIENMLPAKFEKSPYFLNTPRTKTVSTFTTKSYEWQKGDRRRASALA